MARYSPARYYISNSYSDINDGVYFETSSKLEFIRMVRKHGHDMGAVIDEGCGSAVYQILNDNMEAPSFLKEGKVGKDFILVAEGTEYDFFLFEGGRYEGIFPTYNTIKFGHIYYSYEISFSEWYEKQGDIQMKDACRRLAAYLGVSSFPASILKFLLDEENLYDDLPEKIFDYQLKSKVQIDDKVPLTEKFARERLNCNHIVEVNGKKYAYNSKHDMVYHSFPLYDPQSGDTVYGEDTDYLNTIPSYRHSAFEIGKEYENEGMADYDGYIIYPMQEDYSELRRNLVLMEKKEESDNANNEAAKAEPWYAEALKVSREWKAWDTLGKENIRNMIKSVTFQDMFDTEHPSFHPFSRD